MTQQLFDWCMGLVSSFADFTKVLTQPLINGWTILGFISVGGLTALIVILVYHLFKPV